MMNGKINLLNIYPNFTTRLYYIDVLKIISCMAVIILHISSQNLGDYLPNGKFLTFMTVVLDLQWRFLLW